MTVEPDVSKSDLENIMVDRALIERLYANHSLTAQARMFALNLLYPHKNWATWVAYFLLTIEASLVLSGIIYFFAFNWTKLTTLIKFTAIGLSIISCLIAAYFYTLRTLIGKILLTAAAILIGVFLAVFVQVYQSGADAYQLFAMWAVLISIWVFVANFAALWIIWAVILQIAVGLYWGQAVYPIHEWEALIFSILALINFTFLVAREYGYNRCWDWLQSQWTRTFLTLFTVFFLIIAPFQAIHNFSTTHATLIGLLLCCGIYLAFLYYYRYQQPDLSVLSTVVIAVCVLLEYLIASILQDVSESSLFFWMSVFSFILFIFAVMALKKVAQTMESNHVQ